MHEVPHINTCYVQPPSGVSTPTDILPYREEIAEPKKLLAVCQQKSFSWDQYNLENQNYDTNRTWITWRKEYNMENTKLYSNGFYALCEHPEMFSSVLDVDPEDPEEIIEWLNTWCQQTAVITSPLMMMRTPTDSIFYAVPNDVNITPFNIIPIFDLTQQFIDQNAYTVINGLTLAIAMNRLGIWHEYVFYEVMRSWLSTLDMEQPWTEVTTENSFLFLQHPMPHVSEHPLHYAVMGIDKASYGVVKKLRKYTYSYMDDPHVQFHTASFAYFTTVAASMFPYMNQKYWKMFSKPWKSAPTHFDDEDVVTRDIGGFLMSIVRSRSQWKWFEKNHHKYTFIWGNSASDTEILLRRLFTMVSNPKAYRACTSRVRKLWKLLFIYTSPANVLIALVRLLISSAVRSWIVEDMTWGPEVPIAFMKDLRAFNKFDVTHKRTHHIIYRVENQTLIQTVFGPTTLEVAEINESGLCRSTISISLLQLIRRFPEGSSMHTYSKMIDKELCKIAWAISAGFLNYDNTDDVHTINDRYTLGTILNDHFQDHPNSWLS
jgi:hypothetical protein